MTVQPVYLAHGYREREAPFAAYFGSLCQRAGLLPSLDPPSDDVNAAKLERHLGFTKGLVAVVSEREEGPSPHILFEVSMGVRAGSPVLVFVEDSLPGQVVPKHVLQRRFSARSYVRETREHEHALEILRAYIGHEHTPKYQPSNEQRSCLFTGLAALPGDLAAAFRKLLEKRGYSVVDVPSGPIHLPHSSHLEAAVRTASVAVCVLDDPTPASMYHLGMARSQLVPTITLSTDGRTPPTDEFPAVYQRRVVEVEEPDSAVELLENQIELFEEDFIELDSDGKAENYAHQLGLAAASDGHYSDSLRSTIIQEITMGDRYSAGQAGVQGPGAHAHDMTFNQIWTQSGDGIDLRALGGDLEGLREHLRGAANLPEHDVAIGAVANAEIAAKAGDGPGALAWLAKAGEWALDNASKIGVGVAVAALKAALGV